MKDRQKEKILFSIVIPVYNEENFITQCIESLKQVESNNFNIEIIVVDNNSTDNTIKKVNKLDNIILIKEEKQGVGAARYAGTKFARGKFILHIDADTHLPKNYINEVYKKFINDKKLVCAGGQFLFYDAPIWKNILRFLNYRLLKIFAIVVSLRRVGPMGNNMTFRKDVYDKTSGFDKELRYGEDMNICRKMSKFGKIRLFNDLKCYVSVRRFVINKSLLEYFLNFIKMCLTGKPLKNALPHSENISKN